MRKPARKTSWMMYRVGLFILAVGTAMALYTVGREEVYGSIQQELMAVARTGASFVDASAVKSLKPGDEGTETYQLVRGELDHITAATPSIRQAYLLAPTEDPKQYRFLTDTDREDPAAIGEELDVSSFPDLPKGMNEPAADHTLTTDRWGEWLSGYAPVRDADGKAVAVLGIDLPAHAVRLKLIWLGLIAAAFGTFTAVSAAALARWLSNQLGNRVKQVGAQVQELSQRVGEPALEGGTPGLEDPEDLLRYYERLVARLEDSQEQLHSLFHQTLGALAAAVETRDTYTGDHCDSVGEMTEAVALRLGYPREEMYLLRWAAVLHDIGKIGVPDQVLLKPGPLNPEEWKIIQEHPRIGYELLVRVKALQPVAEVVLSHHERWDGKGYPRNLAGTAIPLGARIIAVADTFSAMTTDRPYRRGLSVDVAVSRLEQAAGTQFDPQVVTALLDLLREGAFPLKARREVSGG